MTTHSEREALMANATKQSVASGEIGMAITWAVFYAIAILAPAAAKLAPVGTVVALLSK
jgi:hypothetical protein